VQQATALVQQALTARTQQAVQMALRAVTRAVTDASAAANATHRLVTHEQQRTQGKMPPTFATGASEAMQAMEALTNQLGSFSQAITSDQTGQVALAQLGRVHEIMNGIESALAQASTAVQDTLAAKTAYEQALEKNRALAHARQKYLAQYGGIDPNEIMEQVRTGHYPAVPAGIMLHKNEIVLCALPSSLAEDKTTRQRVGGYAGYSIPVGYGVRFRVGSYRGRTISHEQLTTVDQGTVIVTTQRIVFNGSRRTVAIPLGKVLNTVLYRDGVDVRTDNRTKREVFQCRAAQLLNTYILVACQLA